MTDPKEALIERLLVWLRKRAEPDSGIRYEGDSFDLNTGRRELSRVTLRGEDANFIAKHFHGSGAAELADALASLSASVGVTDIRVLWQRAMAERHRNRDLPDFSLPASTFPDYRTGGGGTLGSPQKCIRQDCDCFDTWNCSRVVGMSALPR